ncbi:MAG: hemolysin III family protein [Candidatus Sericytochromatia bacterium]|nr:hemolysin III family protein [Candidatus Tanganyikabacteria bacterium]
MSLQTPAADVVAARPRFREPVNGFLHLGGFVLSVLGTALLLWRCYPDAGRIATAAIFGGTMSLCFLASTFHHLISAAPRTEIRLFRIDYAAIYPFIAGCYTPICIHMLPGPSGRILLAMVWAIAMIGVVYQLALAPDPPDVAAPPSLLMTAIYVALGWLAVTQLMPLIAASRGWTIGLMAAGGLAYTFGAIVFTRKLFDYWPGLLGHHEIWHVCVLLGAGCHYFYIYLNIA